MVEQYQSEKLTRVLVAVVEVVVEVEVEASIGEVAAVVLEEVEEVMVVEVGTLYTFAILEKLLTTF